VAGGQGTRLGLDGPKGCLPVTPIKRKSLFQVFAEQILATARRHEQTIPWYVMTSPANDLPTRTFFEKNDYFGLCPDDIMFFPQGTMPAIDLSGKLLLAAKDSLALSPDGHGGSLTALRRSGTLEDMARRGIQYISYFQVDNPLVRCVDPLFIGLHAEAGAEMSAKALPKRDPLEKLGNFCKAGDKTVVIEYSDLPEHLATATEPDGRLRFRAGSIAIHVISRSFAERLTSDGRCQLPYHRAVKKVPCIDAKGRLTEPPSANAAKLEQFVFDAMPLAERTVIMETSRIEEFSPVKNASGSDSLSTCLHDQVRRAAGWLQQAGVQAPLDADGVPAAVAEISPLFALDAKELREKLPQGLTISPGQDLYLGD
jgi:UDP-N-acetylglucosamine/UDP-N-acetylgalactosamine diphosphorylase